MSNIPQEQKDAAVFEQRHWVRLTRACNNKCMFCLDTGAQNGTVVPEDEVKKKIMEGRKKGAQRLILSGGEPTLHKKFTEFVAFGKSVGYTWVQVVSNGRMFSYPKFVVRAVKNGLDEATISMHGHKPALHDRLVGVNGAFEQSLKGLKNLIGLRRVVSVDIVLNRLNLPYLREMLEFFMDLGVYEFDLLHLIPFGRAFDEYFDVLSYDLGFAAPHLRRALELKDTPGLVLWTNRLPVSFLEGAEDLVQDPHKIYDEVLGEREAFKLLVSEDKDPDCMGNRCPYCPVRGFCDFSRAYVHKYFAEGFDQAVVSKEMLDNRSGFVRKAIAKQSIKRIWVDFGNHRTMHENAGGIPGGDTMGLWTNDPKEAELALKRGLNVILWLNKQGLKQAQAMDFKEMHGELTLEYPLFERLDQVREQTPDITGFAGLAKRLNARVQGLPACLLQEINTVDEPMMLDLDMIRDNGQIDLAALVGRFITKGNFAKSTRCELCIYNSECRGLQLNLARYFGLKILQPFTQKTGR